MDQPNQNSTNQTETKLNYLARSRSTPTRHRRTSLRVDTPETRALFARKEVLELSKAQLRAEKLRCGMIPSVHGRMSTEPSSALSTVSDDFPVRVVDASRRSEDIAVKEVLHTSKARQFKLILGSFEQLVKFVLRAQDTNKKLMFLCSDMIQMKMYIRCFNRMGVKVVESARSKGATSVMARGHAIGIMTVIDYLVSRSYDASTLCDVYFVLDCHLRTAPYRALMYLVSHMVKFQKSSVVHYSAGNAIKLLRNKLSLNDMRLSTMEPEMWSSNISDVRIVRSFVSYKVLMILSSMDECYSVKEHLESMGLPKVRIAPDTFVFDQIDVYLTELSMGPFVLLCPGWPERFSVIDFDYVYDCGYSTEITWKNGFCLRRLPIFVSDYGYRMSLAKHYYVYVREEDMRNSPDHSNSLVNMDVKALLLMNGFQPQMPMVSPVETMLTGRAPSAVMAYLATYLPAPVFFSYVNMCGDVDDNFHAGVSLYVHLCGFSLSESGEPRAADTYKSWVEVRRVSRYIHGFAGYTRVPCVSQVRAITTAMLLVNGEKHPRVYEVMQEANIGDVSPVYTIKDIPEVKPSVSSPVRSVSGGDDGIHSPLSPTLLTNAFRFSCTSEGRPSHEQAMASIDEIVDDYGSEKKEVSSKQEEEKEDSVSIYSMDSKFSFKRKSGRRGAIKRKMTDMANNIVDTSKSTHFDLKKLGESLDKNFGRVGLSPQSQRKDSLLFTSLSGTGRVATVKLCDVTHNSMIVPLVGGVGNYSIQDPPSSEEIVIVFKYVDLYIKRGRTYITDAALGRVFVAFCKCWNALLCGKRLDKNQLNVVHKTQLLMKSQLSRVRDLMNLPQLLAVARVPPLGDLHVRVLGTSYSFM